jgi:very-short-patch-repair endonuclease
MKLIILSVIAIAIIILIIKEIKNKKQQEQTWPFYAKKLLSQPEQILYFRLIEALPEHIILAQVQLSQILGVKKGNNHQAWLNRISRMSTDFVVCNKDSSIVAVIELDDATHQRKDRQTADAKKDKALNSAGIKIIRWQARSMPNIETIKNNFTDKIN